MSAPKKPRGDSKLDALKPAQKELLSAWLTEENLTYAQARERVREEFGVSTTTSALSVFFSRYAVPRKYALSRAAADEFSQLMEGKFDEATIKAAKQAAFDALSSPTPDLKAAKTLLKIVGDSSKLTLAQEKLSLDARKVALLESKAAQADQAKSISGDSALTPAEKEARIKAVFGIH